MPTSGSLLNLGYTISSLSKRERFEGGRERGREKKKKRKPTNNPLNVNGKV
jgi:hypothetical protein